MSTNYYKTLITLAPDSPTQSSVVPDLTKESVASQQYRWISEAPYELTSDDVIFRRVAKKEGLQPADIPPAQAEYFAKGRACLRTSPLAKQYGWGIYSDEDGKLALVPAESQEYRRLIDDSSVTKIAAMRRSR